MNGSRLYDPIRRRFVAASPEEIVRQHLLARMLWQLGYPKGLVAVEKELGNQHRRFDIVCYTPNKDRLTPLLVIECKAEEAWDEAIRQVLGYNSTLGAPFLCLACNTQIRTIWLDRDRIASVDFLPAYSELVRLVSPSLGAL